MRATQWKLQRAKIQAAHDAVSAWPHAIPLIDSISHEFFTSTTGQHQLSTNSYCLVHPLHKSCRRPSCDCYSILREPDNDSTGTSGRCRLAGSRYRLSNAPSQTTLGWWGILACPQFAGHLSHSSWSPSHSSHHLTNFYILRGTKVFDHVRWIFLI